jgi:hypothetical protein
MEAAPETKKALIVVRTYPTPATNGAEISCTAAITDKGEWLRLFPVPWRYLPQDQRFRKYQWVEMEVKKARDPRPESYKLVLNSIRIVSDVLKPDNEWQARKDVVLPLRSHCLCCLVEKRNTDKYPTLGIFRPKAVKRLLVRPASDTWTPDQLAILRQGHLFETAPLKQLEKIPHKFQYEFECDHAGCSGHTIICTDWEMSESFRKWKQEYGDGWEEKFRQKYEAEMIGKRDLHFFVGTMHGHPGTWIIVGLFYPPSAKDLDDTQPMLTGFR